LTVCQPVELPLAKGDQLQLKANRSLPCGKELTNGELVTVEAVNPDGQIELKDGRILPANYREFVRGYAITVLRLTGQNRGTRLIFRFNCKAATNNQQWLVTISRGTRAVKIYTASKEQLRENVNRMGNRELAIEFAKMDSPGFRPVPVRKYINGLIQSRRPKVTQMSIERLIYGNTDKPIK